ncbi:cellulose acetylase [Azorhizobium caulinodans ORS 571]|uniref:Probable alginate O-acetylase AlgI n=1 Tax=Azorhizobium caulinodans (strain ATCC 43989 / DSM 5975 / JCM 20966 / LMG 6465 / NBRC 14845 / NCIMB 13405 / ORS 571) TaxID=438753 RepID=A8ICJ9_AZOC5|nr:MBOAT family O-acyltransferase [Azorhizobium caulinodans]BAF89217.1 cellulose acetylase [Azorhizobium caulinodans ORS 571]
MVFASDSFIFLFLPVFLATYALAPAAWRNLVILAFSWTFYAWWRLDFLPLIVSIAVWSWLTGLWIAARPPERRRLPLIVAILWPLLALVWFKYANLFAETALSLGAPLTGWQAIVLPIGLSFFVFGAISYSVDVARGTVKAEPSFINYATYQSMFGHLVAGPVVRYEWVAERLKARAFDRDEFALGVERFMLGFAQKVLLADTLAPLVDAGFSLSNPSAADVGLSVLAYALQLYFDFAGYSSMAIGLGLMVGLKFHENFDNPYLSFSITEFWRRWHISLSTWLRDYLYIPLGGSRTGLARSCVNVMITMGLGGLWHGASWTFLVWGLWHGIGLVWVRLWRAVGLPVPPVLVGHVATLLFVLFGWLLFRAQTWAEFGVMLHGLSGANGWGLSDALGAALRPTHLLTIALGIALVYVPLAGRASPQLAAKGRWLTSWSALPLWLAAVWVLQGRTVVPFLYFQF